MIKNKLLALFLATYPHNYPVSLVTCLGVAITGNLSVPNVILSTVLFLPALASTAIINVIEDWDSDSKNKKNLFVHKEFSKRQLSYFYLALAFFSLALATYFNYSFVLAIALEILLGLAYSIRHVRLKDIAGINYLNMGLMYGLAPLLSGIFLFTTKISNADLVILILITAYVSFGSQIKDFEDLAGDKRGSTIAFLKLSSARKLYMSYHLAFFAIIILLITLGSFPMPFLLVITVTPLYVAFFMKFSRAETRDLFRELHMQHQAISLLLLLAFIMAAILSN